MDPELLKRWLPWAKRAAGKTAITLAIAAVAGIAGAQLYPGPKQPIPFSHKLHAGSKGISCMFCHTDVDRASHPGMPPVDKCLLCHNVIIPEFQPIRQLHEYKRKNQGVPWNRVNLVPDHVHFNHQINISMGFDCSKCHGDVKAMDRIHEVNKFGMGFCVNCHKANGASTDCNMCHR